MCQVCSSPSKTMILQRLSCDIPLDYCSSLSDVRVWHVSFQGPFHDRSPAAGASTSTGSQLKKSLKKRGGGVVFLTQVISVVWTVGRFQKLNRITDYSARMESGRLQVSKKSLRHLSCLSYYIVQLHLEYLLIFVIYSEEIPFFFCRWQTEAERNQMSCLGSHQKYDQGCAGNTVT